MSGEALRCAGVSRFIDTYIDGEFGEHERGELEAHLAECPECRQKVKQHVAWKAAVRAAAPREKAPAALRNRVLRGIRKQAAPPLSWSRWAVRALPVAAACGVLGVLAFSKLRLSPVAADVVAKHQRNLPIEVSGPPEQLKHWYQGKVDFPVRVPVFGKASLRGGRLANVGDRQAAYLVYDAAGSKVSVFVFDPSDLRLDAAQRRMIGNKEVYLDEQRGYNVLLYRERGVGVAIASDLDAERMVEMVSSAVTY
jgi:anti-sigma factor (TIGR02949 family)